MSKLSPTAINQTFNKVGSALAIALCLLGVRDAANAATAENNRPVRDFGLLAAYGYMAYRNTRTLLTYHKATPSGKTLTGVPMHRHQSQFEWDFGRTMLIAATEYATLMPEAKLISAAVFTGFGTMAIKRAYGHKKLAGPNSPE